MFIIALCIIFLQGSALPATAAIEAFVQTDKDGSHYVYSYKQLRTDYIKYQQELAAPLFQDFVYMTTIALKDSVNGYVDYKKFRSAYISAQSQNQSFDADAYTSSKNAILYSIPSSVTKVSLDSGNLIRNVVQGPTVTNMTVGEITPVTDGTSEAPILTFSINPTATYSSGTADLSEDVFYRIKNDKYNITGTANKTDNLVNNALVLLGTYGNGGNSVSGSTLINNSPLYITLSNDASRIYTINFDAK
jgi:hypothetical protein